TEHTVTITITGVNDGAVISGADTGAVPELALPDVRRCRRPPGVTDVDGADEAKFVAGCCTPRSDAPGRLGRTESGGGAHKVANSGEQKPGKG
ncbi:VCBS domain-containing protein, partial [Aeromonas salmonicida]|uniref:VCBS domain-containing protein n=1 Tax=Aeromonas salmonicida TaxID=645 RepID=UPI003D3137D0